MIKLNSLKLLFNLKKRNKYLLNMSLHIETKKTNLFNLIRPGRDTNNNFSV